MSDFKEIKAKIIGAAIVLGGKEGIAVDVKPYTGSGQIRIKDGCIEKRNAFDIKVKYPDESTKWIKGIDLSF